MALYERQLADRGFPEVSYKEFYRTIFPADVLDQTGKMTKGKYTGILREIHFGAAKTGKKVQTKTKRYTITDDLSTLERLQKSNDFCIIAPLSYAGKEATAEHSRYMHALCIEVDSLKRTGLKTLLHQINNIEWLPRPTFIVTSGTGLHLYYVFKEPLPLFKNVAESLTTYKNFMTHRIWSPYITTLCDDKIQYEPIYQAFRAVGSRTKKSNKDRVKAFRTGDLVDVEYLNKFVTDGKSYIDLKYSSKMPLERAKEKYPEWYERRVVQGAEKGSWTCKTALYEWWKRKIQEGAMDGHRYYCLMILSIYAIKCAVPYDVLKKDAYALLPLLEKKTEREDNHFTKKDVEDALKAYFDKSLRTFPIGSIEYRSAIRVERNKRNGRKQELHLKLARSNQAILDETNGTCWRNLDGRPTKQDTVKEWRASHPNGTKSECIRETGLSKHTVYKWWE